MARARVSTVVSLSLSYFILKIRTPNLRGAKMNFFLLFLLIIFRFFLKKKSKCARRNGSLAKMDGWCVRALWLHMDEAFLFIHIPSEAFHIDTVAMRKLYYRTDDRAEIEHCFTIHLLLLLANERFSFCFRPFIYIPQHVHDTPYTYLRRNLPVDRLRNA